ncbi:hypothetical protein [Chondrinema litorale]|uniref:hypothetical protein n=1 Tax=Chondrinema litorale TaxID=2994555 RepID=UPI002543A392|nr:hypothetical protein [Chondrinema litorale]UZS00070.1 hypothetical protein OQ292_39715 [Chondrinema litorale]
MARTKYIIIFCFFSMLSISTKSFGQYIPFIIYDKGGIKTRTVDLIKNFIKDWFLQEIQEEVDEEKLEVFLDNILEQYQDNHLANFSLESIKDLLLANSGTFTLIKDVQGLDFTGYSNFPTDVMQNAYTAEGNKLHQAKKIYTSINYTEGNIPKTIEEVESFKESRNKLLLGFDEYTKKRKVETAILYKELSTDLIEKANEFLKEVKKDGKEGMRMSESERIKAINICYQMIGDAYKIIEESDKMLNNSSKMHPIWDKMNKQYEWKLMREELLKQEF